MTEAQRSFLEHCAEHEGRASDYGPSKGGIARGSTIRVARALIAKGLLHVVGFGVDEDVGMEGGEDWPIYAATPAGRAALSTPARKETR